MFKHRKDLFNEVKCPATKGTLKCQVLNCIFQHDDNNKINNNIRKRISQYDENNDNDLTNSGKRRDLGQSKDDKKKDATILIPLPCDPEVISRDKRNLSLKRILSKIKINNPETETPNRDALSQEQRIALTSKLDIEYLDKVTEFLDGNLNGKKKIKDARFVLPKAIAGTPPATIQDRKKFIQQIVEVYRQFVPELKTPINKSTDDEYEIAIKSTLFTYAGQIKKFIFDLGKNEGRIENNSTPKELTNEELLKRLDAIVIPRETLKKFGYIMDTPEVIELDNNKVCHRCGKEFKLSEILEPTTCIYHSGRNRKTSHKLRNWDCCGGIVGDCDPCAKLDHHVFYWSSPEEMHTAIPFTNTNTLPENKNAFKALGIDCEMGFTTKGFELLRTTAIDFITGEEVFDILVRPKGEVIDFNTKWSGISEIKQEAVLIENHLELLLEIMDKNTILIGHGLENDMNAMRLIHERIVDTSILYPKHKTGPRMKYSLKYLCFTYLGRVIQTGEHDSAEDSLGAIDVVKFFLKKD